MILTPQTSKIQNCFEIRSYLFQVQDNDEIHNLEIEELIAANGDKSYTGTIIRPTIIPPGLPVLESVRISLNPATTKEEAVLIYLETLKKIHAESTAPPTPSIVVPTAEESHKLRLV